MPYGDPELGGAPMSAADLPPPPWPRPEAILTWVDTARPGERLVYFRGFLATDPAARAVGLAARTLMADGKVNLTQARLGLERFDYIVERRGGRA